MLYDPRYQVLREELVGARLRAGFTQVTLAEKLNRAQSFISKVETGERYVDVLDLLAWCEATKVDPYQVLHRVQSVNGRQSGP